jgi:serine/threonine protein kinase
MKKVGEYVLLSELGKGQFGTVYKAKNCITGDIFAIKTVLKSSVNGNTKLKSLFNTEISIMSKIKHPNILHLYEYLETGNNYYLIIDYCNNGDMESYVKKHQFLGENESVYFLMQIMNGFKELHKNKIMHRDFKLANIFLNDDKLIIGDFGFAKSGVDMTTTKLGSPITMAPELLLSQGGKLTYTNKADLWSIGICFYQMIFGCLPWDVKDMDDLKLMVKTRSGRNLPFPSDKGSITPECRELLVKLLEQDPNQRIEWDDFFKHKLFALHDPKNKMADANVRQSIMFRNNEEIVKQMFDQNKKEELHEVELAAEPEKINLEGMGTVPGTVSETSTQTALNRLKARVISRYTHEKKTIVFFMYTCRRLRNLAKERGVFRGAANNLMYAAILLLKKGIIMNEAAVMSLKQGVNIYSIEGFDQFASLEDRGRLREELEVKDTLLYNKLFTHLKDKVREEVESTDPRRDKILALISDPNCTIQAVDVELRRECSVLIPHFSKPPAGLNEQSRFELLLSLAHAYVSAYQNEYLGYLKEGVPFDWNEFEKSWNGKPGAEKINAILLKAMGG